jgi:hypothetical protein
MTPVIMREDMARVECSPGLDLLGWAKFSSKNLVLEKAKQIRQYSPQDPE